MPRPPSLRGQREEQGGKQENRSSSSSRSSDRSSRNRRSSSSSMTRSNQRQRGQHVLAPTRAMTGSTVGLGGRSHEVGVQWLTGAPPRAPPEREHESTGGRSGVSRAVTEVSRGATVVCSGGGSFVAKQHLSAVTTTGSGAGRLVSSHLRWCVLSLHRPAALPNLV